ncbi:hypothetical protein RRG08_036494 [Elysia crispata]|uniref:Uncharacterized protein n=1 Tax=Elysia crispata TaxID=231223 RepID=A0AAE1DID4_9GAST|nr:hypothetical protein RRG08_036494 [Elysia crispata]
MVERCEEALLFLNKRTRLSSFQLNSRPVSCRLDYFLWKYVRGKTLSVKTGTGSPQFNEALERVALVSLDEALELWSPGALADGHQSWFATSPPGQPKNDQEESENFREDKISNVTDWKRQWKTFNPNTDRGHG